jgi:ATP adenylyltransferase
MKYIAAPWRWRFITGADRRPGCVFCRAAAAPDDDESLVVRTGSNFFVILNKYPYATGHLMIAPVRHLQTPDQVSPADSQEMWALLHASMAAIRAEFNPDGFNVGMNVGGAAGAGIKEHFHLHLVPRWQGDANFMAVVGETRVMSYDLADVTRRLRQALAVPAQELS